MLAFVDESGDTGRRTIRGTSRFFVVAVVVFQDNDAAQRCDDAISRLRQELGLPARYEFHYKDNPAKVKTAFLNRVSRYSFNYYVFAIDKSAEEISDSTFANPEDLYRFAIVSALELAEPVLNSARVTLDRRGDKRSRNALAAFIRQRTSDASGSSAIRDIKTQRSNGNNLLQLADYVVGVANRTLGGSPREENFRRQYLMRHEVNREIWP